MVRRCYLLLLTLLLTLVVLQKVHAYSDDNEDSYEDDYEDDHDEVHEEDYDCDEDHDNHEEEGLRLLTPQGISPMAIGGLGRIMPLLAEDFKGNTTIGVQTIILPSGSSTCSETGFSNAHFKRFNAIFFGDFYTFEGNQIFGPLAVKGNFIATNYVVNANAGQDCSAQGSVDSYGLVAGTSSANRVQIHGSALIQSGGDLTQIQQLEANCYVTNQQGTGVVDFIAMEVEASRLNKLYREHTPSLQLQADGSFQRLTDADKDVEYMTFNTCNDRASCTNIWPDQMSVADNIFLGQPNWNGVQGAIGPDSSKTYVFNIPVIENTRITLTTNQPTQGFNGCKVIYNFYAVKSGTGEYSPTGDFTIARNTGGPLIGLTLAPRGDIIDGPVGHFAGQIVALSYTWAYTNGVSIYNYKGAGEDCVYYDGCNVDKEVSLCTVEPETFTMTATQTSVQTRLSIRTQKTTLTELDTTTEIDKITTTEYDTATERTTVTQKITTTRQTYTETVRVPISVTVPRDVIKTVTNANTVFATSTQFSGTLTKTSTLTQLNTATTTKINTATVTERETETERTTITQRSTQTQTSRITARTTTTARETEIDTIYLTEDHTVTKTVSQLQDAFSTTTEVIIPDTITTVIQYSTITKGVETSTETQLSTVTTSIYITLTATSTLQTEVTVTKTVTSLLDYFATVTTTLPNCNLDDLISQATQHMHDEDCGHTLTHTHDKYHEDDEEEDQKDSYKKKWYHKEFDDEEEDDDCEDDDN